MVDAAPKKAKGTQMMFGNYAIGDVLLPIRLDCCRQAEAQRAADTARQELGEQMLQFVERAGDLLSRVWVELSPNGKPIFPQLQLDGEPFTKIGAQIDAMLASYNAAAKIAES